MKVQTLLRSTLGVLLLFALTDPPTAQAERLEEHFAVANDAAARGEYALAIQGYQALLDAGVRDPDVYFNLGRSHMARGEYGIAILQLERAIALAPGDSESEATLAQIRELLGNRDAQRSGEATVQTRPPLSEALVRSMSADSIALWLLLSVLGASAGIGVLWTGRQRVSEGLRLALGVSAALLVISSLLAGVAMALELEVGREGRAAVVLQADTRLREGPDMAAVTRGPVNEGELVRMLQSRPGFRQVLLQDGQTGWIPTESVAPL